MKGNVKTYKVTNEDLTHEFYKGEEFRTDQLYKSFLEACFSEPQNCVYLCEEIETDAEADKRRLDWLEPDGKGYRPDLAPVVSYRQFIDFHCPPPSPKIIILAAPDGWTLEQVAPEIAAKFEIVDGREK